MSDTRFRSGDRVIHAGQPEWGVGQVVSAQSLQQNGESVQRLTVRFERAGLRTVSTSHADIRPAGPAPVFAARSDTRRSRGVNDDDSAAGPGWLEKLERGDPATVLRRLPEPTTDPFSSLEARIRATLDLYRFTGTGASLIDWAAAQTGLSDPLSQFTRQELENYFTQFETERNNHLKKLAKEARRTDPDMLRKVTADAAPAAQQVLRRADG